MLLTLTPFLASLVFWTPSNACSIILQNKYKTTARLLSILVSFLDYDMVKRVEAGGTLRRSRVWIVPHNGFAKKLQSLKPASSILSEKNDHILWF